MAHPRSWKALAFLLCAAGGAAQSAPSTVALHYVRAPGTERCPDERWIRQAVSARLGADPFQDDGALKIEAQIRPDGAALAGSIDVTRQTGEAAGHRELRSEA